MTRILVVEDDESVLLAILTSLRALGHDVVGAPDGLLALSRVETEPFDLLLTDVEMPNMSGLVLLERVRESRPGLRVLVMSGASGNRVGALALGAVGFLDKPLGIDELVSLIPSVPPARSSVSDLLATTP